jgi:hypothetical protein
MEITTRGLWTLVHGMGFGGLYLLACSGALVALQRRFAAGLHPAAAREGDRFLGIYFAVMAALAWLAVLSGTYVIYPWYRAPVAAGTTNLAAYPRALLLSNPETRQWHLLGMEWKEHIAWLVPIVITMAAYIAIRYGRDLKNHPELRTALQGFVFVSLFAGGVAGFFGAMLDKTAPTEGGQTIQLMQGAKP